MAYALKANSNGDVEVVMKAGSDYVRTVMPKGKAEGILATAESVEKTTEFGLNLCVNGGQYYFAGSATTKAEKPADEAEAEPKAEKKTAAKKSTAKKK